MTTQNARPLPSYRLFVAVGASLIAGFLLPIVLAFGPAVQGGESRMTGAALLGWGIGWALLALSSIRFTSQPQRWALVPAGILGVTGLALVALAPGAAVMDVLAWIWPIPVMALSAWLATRVRGDVQGRSRWLLYPVVATLALLAVGGALETVVETTGRSAVVGGQLVDVGGHKLFISCSGTGSPTVVLEGGLGQGSAYFAHIVPKVAQVTRVCAYDRAGRGDSEPAAGPQDGPAIARDLHALLVASGNTGPFVVAAHSSGGVYARFFAAAYADEVIGVVLLDAQSPHATPVRTAGQAAAPNPMAALSGFLPGLARVGIARLVTSGGSSELPADVEARRHAAESTTKGVASFGEEFVQLDGILDAAGALPDLGDRPLAIVTAEAEALDGWLGQQDRLATLSTNASHRVYPDLTHDSLIETPKGATAASEAILAVVSSIRSGTRLGSLAASDQ